MLLQLENKTKLTPLPTASLLFAGDFRASFGSLKVLITSPLKMVHDFHRFYFFVQKINGRHLTTKDQPTLLFEMMNGDSVTNLFGCSRSVQWILQLQNKSPHNHQKGNIDYSYLYERSDRLILLLQDAILWGFVAKRRQ